MSNNSRENVGGRPTKLDERFVKVTREVLEREEDAKIGKAVVYTDKDLVDAINYKLREEYDAPKACITQRLFRSWKSKLQDEGLDALEPLPRRFFLIYKRALQVEKEHLLEGVMNRDESQWQRYSWILQRKFDEFNIKHKKSVEHSGGISLSELSDEADEMED